MSHAKPQVVYQIFPERFAIGRPHDSRSKLALPAYQKPGYSLRTRHEPVLREPGSREAAADPGLSFYGGDLQGVTDHLAYLQDLGATTLYFTPVFEAPSNHKYDAVSFDQVDPMFGGDAAFATLLSATRERGMGVVLDAALNHVSFNHPGSSRPRREAPYRDWFTFLDPKSTPRSTRATRPCWPRPTTSAGGATATWPSCGSTRRAWKTCCTVRPGSLLRRFLDQGIQGWRFDTGEDIGLPFVRRMRASLQAAYPKAELLGELMNYGGG